MVFAIDRVVDETFERFFVVAEPDRLIEGPAFE